MAPNTFESEWAQRWRALEEMEASQKEALDKQFKEAREKLEAEMEQAIQEHEAVLMRQGFLRISLKVFILFQKRTIYKHSKKETHYMASS